MRPLRLNEVGISITAVIIGFAVFLWAYSNLGCSELDRYMQEGRCFDINYRCNVECTNYGWNYTNKLDGCKCDCGTHYVSYCSGFAYKKEGLA